MRSRLLPVLALAVCVIVVMPSAATAATTAPTLAVRITENDRGVRVTWSFATDARQRDRVVQIQRSVGGGQFQTVLTRVKAARKASWVDWTVPTGSMSYRARAVIAGVATAWGPTATLNVAPATTTTTTAPGNDNDLPPLAPGQTWCGTSAETSVLSQVNAERTSRGIAAVTRNLDLAQSARDRSVKNAASGTLVHSQWSVIRSYGYTGGWLAENIAYGVSSSNVVPMWMGSAGHRANILGTQYRHAGVSCVKDTRGVMWWTLDLGG